MTGRLRGWFDHCRLSPRALRRMHGWLTVMWAAMIPVSVFTGLRNSVPYLVALSVYALFGAHFSAWQASRSETSD